MAVPQFVYDVIEEQEALVMQLDDSAITEEAKRIAFYAAMINAAVDDPMESAEWQREMLAFFENKMTDHVETYQSLVNDKL